MNLCDEMASAIEAIVAAWEGGDLAGAVNVAQEVAWQYRVEQEVQS
jgi:hypothetical protein